MKPAVGFQVLDEDSIVVRGVQVRTPPQSSILISPGWVHIHVVKSSRIIVIIAIVLAGVEHHSLWLQAQDSVHVIVADHLFELSRFVQQTHVVVFSPIFL